MATTCDPLILYLHLARAAELRRRPLARDKLLVMASVAAMEDGLEPVAAFCRARILEHNPAHLLRKFPDFGEALANERFRAFLARVERDYSRERAEHMLESLGIELGREQEVYQDANEYAAALLGTTPAELDAWYAQERGSKNRLDLAISAPAASPNNGDAPVAQRGSLGNGRAEHSTGHRPGGLALLCGLFLLAGTIVAMVLWGLR